MLETVLLEAGNPFLKAVNPIIELINMATGPLLMIVLALGTLYCVFLGVKLAKAEEPQDREKAKGALKNALIGFVMIFVLILALNIMGPAMTDWMNSQTDNMSISIDGGGSN